MRILLFFFLFNTVLFCLGQQKTFDKTIQDKLLFEVYTKVDSIFESDFILSNGRYYIPGYNRVNGHPFFNTNEWTFGKLLLGSRIYPEVKLLYNIYESNLICSVKGINNEDLPLKLNSDLVSGFTIGENVFLNYSFVEGVPAEGFYEVIYQDNKINAYAKWRKKFINLYSKNFLGEFDEQKRTLYISINDQTKEISSKNNFLSCFGKKKKKIKAFMKKNRLKYSKLTNTDLCLIFKYSIQNKD